MFIYQEKDRFDPVSGKPIKSKVLTECLCDVCGESIVDEPGFVPEFSVKVDYGSMDACFGSSGEEYHFGKKYGVDMNSFLSAPFTSHNTWSECGYEKSCDNALCEEIKESGSLADAIRVLKLRTAEMLIKSGSIQPHELASEF